MTPAAGSKAVRSRSGRPRRGLVLGGGGVLGAAWMVGGAKPDICTRASAPTDWPDSL